MMADELLAPDTEGAVKAYLKRPESPTFPYVAGRVYMGVDEPDPPYITVVRIGGTIRVGNVDDALIQVDVYGRDRQRQECWDVTAAVIGALRTLDGEPWTAPSGVTIRCSGPESWVFAPDERARAPRYSLTALVTALPG